MTDPNKRDGFFLAVSKRQADDMAEKFRRDGKIVSVTPRSGSGWTVRWLDWRRPSPPPRGRWNDSRTTFTIPR